ncbi:hypothetical protein FRB96_002696 [Tulasnella sp. 330]|nr:hypothetical protein FRB96_002696 [Tulasnella sp. 330]KAG8884385.1 hypothetical protein FRB97_004394 [Tulasnella sp. 331]KAG8888055.1 hypothetical protein FRB98_008519 [Tulasnella sp. 332]
MVRKVKIVATIHLHLHLIPPAAVSPNNFCTIIPSGERYSAYDPFVTGFLRESRPAAITLVGDPGIKLHEINVIDHLDRLTLASRLEELELSNAEGLLDDEGYRILRQNLFNSYANPNSVILPSEQSPVRVATSSSKPKGSSRSSSSSGIRPPSTSNFHISTAKANSIRSNSRSTMSTVMSNVFRRTSPRLGGGRPSMSTTDGELAQDNGSVYSGVSRASASMHRVLASSKSSGSLRSEYTQSQQDNQSLSSRQTGRSGLTGGSRGTSSRSGWNTGNSNPPSAFNLRRTTMTDDDDDDDAHRHSASEVRIEIAQVEAEFKRILDNYHGAEMGMLAKMPAGSAASTSANRPLSAISQATVTESTWTLISTAHPPIDDSSGGGIKAGLLSAHASPGSPKSSALSRFGSLRRKASNSSSYRPSTPAQPNRRTAPPKSAFPASMRSPVKLSVPPPQSPIKVRSTPNLLFRPSTGGTVRAGRRSDISSEDRPSPTALLSLNTEDEGLPGLDDVLDLRATQRQLDRVRMSREDAVKRYETRLEFLKTKLKTAEIHERLKKKG